MLCAALMFGACTEDNEIGTIVGERNWLVVEDSDDPIDGQRYDIFREFGIPVYYNDTIGQETRYSFAGNPYTYYERLQVFYNPGGTLVTGRFTLLPAEEKQLVKPMLDFLQTELLPMIPEDFYIPSILLVDSLVVGADSVAYKGFNTVVCAQVREFAGMNEDSRRWWMGSVMSSMLANNLINSENEWFTENFFALSQAVNPTSDRVYSSSSNNYYVNQAFSGSSVPRDEWSLGALGFLNHKARYLIPGNELFAFVPTRESDVKQFCEAIFAMSTEEFAERWGEYPVVMAKYEVLKGKLAEYGFEIE